MLEIAEKFKSIGKITRTTNTASAIFGSAGDMSQSVTKQVIPRISFYPIVDSENPEVAMGIASCLCYLLEQYKDVRVYRIFARIDETNGDEFDIEDSQFTSDSWSFDGLDDNVVINSSIIQNDGQNELELMIDRSLLTESDDVTLKYKFGDFPELINKLPQIAEEIVQKIKTDIDTSELIITYSNVDVSVESLTSLLEEVFYWNLDLYLYIWNVEWEDEDIISQFETILELVQGIAHPFATWCVAMVAKQVMQVGLDILGDVIVPRIDEIFRLDEGGSIAITTLGQGLINLGYVDQAIDLVEQHSSEETTDILTWITLIDIYVQSNHFTEAVDANQQAIENGIEDERLYWRYIQLLLIADSNSWFIEELLLIDPNEYDEEDHLTHEIIVALEKIIELNPQSIEAVHLLIPYLIEIEDIEAVWQNLERLISIDESLRYTQDALSNFYELDNLEKGFEILTRNAEKNPNNPYAFLNLAQLAVLDENPALSEQYLEKAGAFVAEYGEELELEIQNLRLSAAFPNFDQQFAEIKTILGANQTVSDQDVTLLEEAIEAAPKIGSLYVTLARCYLAWNDSESAQEVLNEGIEKAGKHPEILATLAQILWKEGKRDEAFAYLNEGIELHPNDVFLLTRIARYLIDNDQLEDAKPYIERADIIAPSHQELWNLKKLITDKLS